MSNTNEEWLHDFRIDAADEARMERNRAQPGSHDYGFDTTPGNEQNQWDTYILYIAGDPTKTVICTLGFDQALTLYRGGNWDGICNASKRGTPNNDDMLTEWQWEQMRRAS